ncbi:putative membrane protein [Moritella sp. JT01]|uniref:hypothetical protein n=1 Tax=Moritella sp. JT01 TaxID=756698 RepID=UPI000794FCA1|nr:hypothetical protein [Moritella sp. JT01]KXO13184.1 putative membrane protein [Moritella sp. JT01]
MDNTYDSDDLITYTISRNVPAAKAAEYELWLKTVSASAATVTQDYLGVTIIRPEHKAGNYHAIVRFSSVEGFEIWQKSQERKDCLGLLDDSLKQSYITQCNGFEYWFTVRNAVPPRWKSILLTYIVIFTLMLTIQPLLTVTMAPYLPSLIVKAIATAVITLTMSLVAMPIMTRLLKKWLYSHTITKI